MDNLFKLRSEKKLNQLNLGMKIGVDQASISGYELGKIYPTIENLLKLCELFDVSADYLLDRTSVRTPVDKLAIENFSSDELEILALYRKLTSVKKERALGILIGLAE